MHRFRIDVRLDPQALPRVVDMFAQRAIMPSTMSMAVLGDRMRIEIAVPDLDAAEAGIVAAKLAQAFVVIDIRLECELAAA